MLAPNVFWCIPAGERAAARKGVLATRDACGGCGDLLLYNSVGSIVPRSIVLCTEMNKTNDVQAGGTLFSSPHPAIAVKAGPKLDQVPEDKWASLVESGLFYKPSHWLRRVTILFPSIAHQPEASSVGDVRVLAHSILPICMLTAWGTNSTIRTHR